MSKYNRGNDVAADDYAENADKYQAEYDWVEHIATKKLEDREWVATTIDGIMSCSDCVGGVTDFAFELADVLLHNRNRDSYFYDLAKLVKASAYDEAEHEIEQEERYQATQKWLGED